MNHRIEQVLLWIFVVLAAVVIGGGLYELRVIIPLWAHAPPESVWEFATQRTNNPAFTPNSGIQFWIYFTPAHLLVSIATFVTAWKTQRAHRRWVMISTAVFIILHLGAIVYFVPAIDKLFNSRNLGMSPAEVASRVHVWVYGTWIRFFIGLGGFLCGLRALQVPPGGEARS
jgi:hypothetical protein